MPSKQGTLGNFLGKSGDKPAPAQQAKLNFSTKDEQKQRPSPKRPAAQISDDNQAIGKRDGKQESVKREDTGPLLDANGKKPSSRSDDKIDNQEAQIDDDDEEPPVKKQRKNDSTNGDKFKSKNEDAKIADRPGKTTKVKAELDQEGSSASASTLPNGKFGHGNGSDDHDDRHNSDIENDDHESADDLAPEEAAKMREKVQTTLKASGKDAYPDWVENEPVPYAALCTTFSKIELTTKRLEIAAYCSLFLRQVTRLTPADLLPVVLLMLGKLAADYSGIELGIGESLIMKAIGETTGRSLQIIKTDQQEIGDLGLVAAKSRSNQPPMFKPKPLTVRSVHDGLMQIALVEGQGSQGRKVAGIKKLLAAADVHMLGKGKTGVDINTDKGGPSESKYIVRTLEGKMRLGLAEKTVLSALANAMVYHEIADVKKKQPSTEQVAKGEEILKNVYNELPSWEAIIPALLDAGIFKLRDACKLRPGVPLKPMLARPTKSITEVLDRFEGKAFSCEYKYDGERAQIHFVSHDAKQDYAATTNIPSAGRSNKGASNIFSRNSEDLSKKYPDILAKLPDWVKDDIKSFVLDCETVAWDMQDKKVLPFQQLMTRKRKDVKTEDIKVKVCVFAFDILYLNGEAMVNKPFRERREAMYKALQPVEGEFAFAQYGDCVELDEIQVMLEESVKASCEGLMVKMLDNVESHYEPSRRSQNWLKVKKDYLAGAGDSLDLVVLGAYYGKGKRTSVYGAFLLACWNPSRETFETVCNIGTGFSDEALAHMHATLSPIVIDKPKPFYSHSAGRTDQPDVWFEPRFVWEVKTADLTLSPRYKAAADQVMDASGKGVSLRFPRYIRERDDKKPEAATTSRQVAEMYKKQEVIGGAAKSGIDDDFEY